MKVNRRRLDVALFGGLLLIGVFVVRSWRQEGEAVPDRPSGPPPVDLLGLIDPARDAVKGAWRKDEQSLVSSDVPFGRLQIPFTPPKEYDLTAVVSRQKGGDSLNIGLSLDGRQFVAILDGCEGGDVAGLDLVGKKGFMDNPTTRRGKLLHPWERRTIVCSVRPARVEVKIDGQTVISWAGPSDQLSLYHEWAVPRKDALFIGSYASEFKIERLTLQPRAEAR